LGRTSSKKGLAEVSRWRARFPGGLGRVSHGVPAKPVKRQATKEEEVAYSARGPSKPVEVDASVPQRVMLDASMLDAPQRATPKFPSAKGDGKLTVHLSFLLLYYSQLIVE